MDFEQMCVGCPDFVTNEMAGAFAGGAFGVLVALGILVLILVLAAVYVYFALAWQTTAKKLKYKRPWLAWIPFANLAMILSIGGFHWAWIFLLVIPFLGWLAVYVLLIIATWKILEKRNYPGWLSLSMIVPKIGGILYLILIGFTAWADRKKR
jgi:hypothetical protein